MPTTKPKQDKYSPSVWGSGGSGLEDVTVPSGQTCLCRRPGVEGLMKAGVLHDLDMLTAIIQKKHVAKVKGKKAAGIPDDAAAMEIMKDPKKLESVLHMVDRVVCHVVVKPEVEMTPSDITNRKDGAVYADMIDLEDKMYLLNYAVGGSRDVEQFRERLSTGVAGLEDESAVQDKAE